MIGRALLTPLPLTLFFSTFLFFAAVTPLSADPSDAPAAAETKVLRFEPVKENGSVIGLKLSNVRPDDGFGRIGFIEGDVIRMLNGKPITKFSQLRQIIADSAKIKAVVLRNGEAVVVEFDGRGKK